MPELPEVERAAKVLRETAVGKTIERVETFEDTIVFAGTTHSDFGTELTGRKVLNASRYGKLFYLELDGEGRMPVLHFGMTGMLQVKGEAQMLYGDTENKKPSTDWPPRFVKFIFHLTTSPTLPDSEANSIAIAFMDARRLGRIRLCADPQNEPPISELGFDPILSMPEAGVFQSMVTKRKCPIKALLLDQSFSAGVGNWVADEVLYHARVHPEERCNELDGSQILQLHTQLSYVCKTAVGVDADAAKFPEHWLFKHRWGKGKRKHSLKLPSGEPATIKFLTVGGRTSAFVAELQVLSRSIPSAKVKETDLDDACMSDLTDIEEDAKIPITSPPKRKRKAPAPKKKKAVVLKETTEDIEDAELKKKRRKAAPAEVKTKSEAPRKEQTRRSSRPRRTKA